MTFSKLTWGLFAAITTAACGTSASSTAPTELEIVPAGGSSLTAAAGDAVHLTIVERLEDGTQQPLPTGALVSWSSPSTVVALDTDSMATSPMPAFTSAPTAIFVDNAARPDAAASLESVLFVADAGASGGTTHVSASVTGSLTATATATITVTATPAGNATRGAPLYAAGCAGCHGATGAGTPANADGTFTLGGTKYDYPAPGINAADGNLASDPDWSPALLALAARADVDNSGVVLRMPMPMWLSIPVHGQPLTTQDFADIYAFLQTQTQ